MILGFIWMGRPAPLKAEGINRLAKGIHVKAKGITRMSRPIHMKAIVFIWMAWLVRLKSRPFIVMAQAIKWTARGFATPIMTFNMKPYVSLLITKAINLKSVASRLMARHIQLIPWPINRLGEPITMISQAIHMKTGHYLFIYQIFITLTSR